MHIKANNTQQANMLRLKNQLQQLNAIIGTKKICYLDLPIHNNVGDLLIMQGTLAFFKLNGFTQTHCLTVFNYFPKAIADDDVIVFQGGGNFGDLYPVHQTHREKVIAAHPNHKIVILPQTIFFEDQSAYQDTCNTLKKHPNLHICVRDHVSYAHAKNMTPNVYLLPDMAHQLYPIQPKTQLTLSPEPIKTLYIKRNDKEQLKSIRHINADAMVDWLDMLGAHNIGITLMYRCQRLLSKIGINRLSASVGMPLWLTYAEHITNRISQQVNAYQLIQTSRLHGFILANLLNKDVHLINNNYGKNQQYFETWMQ